jgi:hypothetical protein
MPHYNVLLALAYKATREERKAASQRQNAQRARTPTFPIGPIIWDSVRRLRPDLTIPEEVITATRLPRTLAGAIEDRLRREAKLQDNAPTLWRWIKAQLGPSAVLTEPKKRNPRRDALLIEMEGRQERLSYVQFQKILTKARQREKTLGDFLEPLARA